MIERAFAVSLSIPDNEAYTALVALQRLGVACSDVRRADVHVYGVDDDAAAEALERIVPTLATVYNPNKHRLAALAQPRPEPGEVWITDAALPQPGEAEIVVGGVRLPGVRAAWRATSWRLLNEAGHDVAAEVLEQAVATLLCNTAFQRAIGCS